MWKLFVVIGAALVAVAATIFSVDQYEKRQMEQIRFRNALESLESRLASKETELHELVSRLGEKNEQVRVLSQELHRLREEVSLARRMVV